ncbi:MAG: DNA-directed DNA polymerase II small subunit [Methanobrevibacter sp.]|jgi:DNA polymerase II small subunit|nr:DNA-directed DNA polymerase II small subunit [Candidatus Methanovirga australis]
MKEVIYKFAEKGINISPEVYEQIMKLENPLIFTTDLILKIRSKFSRKELFHIDEEFLSEYLDEDTNKDNIDNKQSLDTEDNNLNKQNKIKENLGLKFQEVQEDNRIKKENSVRTSDNLKFHNVDNDDNEENVNKRNDNLESSLGKNRAEIENKEKNFIKTKDINSKNINNQNIINQSSTNQDSSNQNIDNQKFNPNENPYQSTIIKKSSNQDQINSFDPSQCFRNLNSLDADYNFKIIQDTTNKSYTNGEIGNFVSYFTNRFEKLSNILYKRAEFKVPQKIKDIVGSTDFNIIGMINDIKTTKNGHRIMDLEDETGVIPILFHKDNQDLFNESENLVKDEVIGLIGEKKGNLAISSKIVYPGVKRVVDKAMDFSIAFISDVHIGSLNFLDKSFLSFINWINGDFGTDEQIMMGKDIKYLIIAGDLVDGIGIYPNQDKELSIKDIAEQYEAAACYLGKIRSDVKIILGPGNHDASRVAEPQTAIPEKYAKSLYQLNNIEFISNPAVVDIEGFNTLIYHGRGFDDLAITIKGMSHEKNELLMEKMLKMRHLAPIYGERTPLASELEDHLVIDKTPDILHTGHVHINKYKLYNGIHLINSGTFQTQTEFQKVHNIVPTAGLVPILHRGKYKELRFFNGN